MNDERVFLVTGATGGIGLEIARGLAKTGATVVMTGRDPKRGETARRNVADSTENSQIHLLTADLAEMSAVRDLAAEFEAKFSRLDALINNAALLTARREVTSEGLERMFAVNFLAPFHLTRLLTPMLRKSAPSRLINLASNAHRWVETLDFANLQAERGFDVRMAYGAQKLANILHAFEFARRFGGDGISANAHHPGEVATNLGNRGSWYLRVYWKLAARSRLSPAQGAAPIVQDALGSSGSGAYFERGIAVEPSPAAKNAELAAKLWNHAETLLGNL